MAFVHDSNTIQRDRVITPQRKHQAEVEKLLADEQKNLIYDEADEICPANSEKQLGRPLTSVQLEMMLEKILPPAYKCQDHPYNSTKKLVVRICPDGVKETVVVYERGFMPEHSIMKVKTTEVRDPNQRKLNRVDMPKHHINEKGEFEYEPGTTRPGWKKITQLWGEKTRGWRTVLIRLIEQRIITLADAERIFGSDNRPQWATHTGKQAIQLPW